ncbi:MAG TPA: hypothetical protein VLA43_12335 [Longimicrobiales bacterium]|nr:hypothetical protein [Longimicrobiales bacterium]
MRSPLLLAVGLALSMAWPGPARAQEIPRGEYLRHVPLGLPRLVPENPASVALHLWGDPTSPAYRDFDPVDGIDDRRHDVLLALAVRFAPFLVQNTSDFPVDFQAFVDNRPDFALHVDTWDVDGEAGRLLGTREVNFSVLGEAACSGPGSERPFVTRPGASGDPLLEDCKLLVLLDEFSPGSGRTRNQDELLVRGNPSLQHVLFFNFPGDGPGNWKGSYQQEYERTPESRRSAFPHAFVHPFLREVAEGRGGAGYELVLQYWFFYPNNDSGMDHEGDWEHMNVVVSPRSMVEGSLDRETVSRILDGSYPLGQDATDPLVMKRVDFYFHNSVWPWDFSSPNAYLPRAEWEAEVASRTEARFQERDIWSAIRYLAYQDDEETVLNTHPFGYIGGDNKGLNQALETPGGSNRDPHGTYPLPGRYTNVGPGGSTDQVTAYVDHREYLRDLREGRATMGPSFRKETVLGLADPARLRILPDWERVVGPVRRDAEVRAHWAWLILPIRWGYPATRSPFSGVLENYNTGNVAPQGPPYNAGWNASGPNSGFKLYDPHTVPSIFPLQLQDAFRNDLGFLNLTVPTLLNLPPLDFLSRIAAYPVRLALGRRDPVYYPSESIPFRFVGISSGLSVQTFHDDFKGLALNPQHLDEFIVSLIRHLAAGGADETTEVVGGADFIDTAVGTFLQIPFYVGGRFTSENTLRNVRTAFGVTADFNNIPDYSYRANLNYWEYAGSIRYSILTSALQPYLKAGYGWSWYRVEDVRAGDQPFTPANSDWIGPGSVWPNVWHYGLGVELVPWKRVGELPGGLELAFRLEYARYSQGLGLDLGEFSLDELRLIFPTLADVPAGERVHRNDFLLGITVTF